MGIAFIRGLGWDISNTIGNFWVDLVRALLWVLLPLTLAGSLALLWQGVPLNLAPYTEVHTMEGRVQTIAQDPSPRSSSSGIWAPTYANPTRLTNFLGLLAIAVLPALLTITFGHMTGRSRAGWVLLAVMVVIFAGGLAVCDVAEAATAPQLADLNVPGGNMEGKEVRFGVGGSVLAALVTSNGATGSYNSMHDSYNPLGVLAPLVNMLLGEVVFGGLGTGIYSIIMIALPGVFLGGLKVGRTPEYLGKKVGAHETKLIALYTLLTPMVVLLLNGLAVVTEAGRAGLTTNGGARGFTEILFA